ncbi:sensor histidine kinase [Joostella sp.]|uniref:sensor histidine kinase n=1 Tax=Joostella sp. TaxID=2231138 RepID=UPI003A8C8ACD
MTKLLHKPLKAFAIYALIILIVSIPVYVLVVDYIWTTELDENNWLTLQHTKQKLQSKNFTTDEVEQINYIWGQLQPGVSIKKSINNTVFKDSIYEVIRANKYDFDNGEDRFRGLTSHVVINGEPYVVTIETNVEESKETFIAIASITLVFFVILIVGFILLNKYIAAKTWKPFYNTLRVLQTFKVSDDKEIKFSSTKIEEFKALNDTLEVMINHNIDLYKQQRSFIENASHELQTPIALLKSKVDSLLQQKGLDSSTSQILNNIEGPLSRLSRINKNLLVLAKVDNYSYGEKKDLDVKALIQDTLLLFEDYIDEKKLSLKNKIQESIIVNTNTFLLETLIHNLLSNAIRHTASNGEIIITSDDSTIEIMNSGAEELDNNKLFKRFSSTSQKKVSSGLGLAIIKEITNKSNWDVTYNFKDSYHIFTVKF